MIHFVLVASVLGQDPTRFQIAGAQSVIQFGSQDDSVTLIRNATEDELVCSGKIKATDVLIEGTSTTVADLIAKVTALESQAVAYDFPGVGWSFELDHEAVNNSVGTNGSKYDPWGNYYDFIYLCPTAMECWDGHLPVLIRSGSQAWGSIESYSGDHHLGLQRRGNAVEQRIELTNAARINGFALQFAVSKRPNHYQEGLGIFPALVVSLNSVPVYGPLNITWHPWRVVNMTFNSTFTRLLPRTLSLMFAHQDNDDMCYGCADTTVLIDDVQLVQLFG